jgi:phage-related protein
MPTGRTARQDWVAILSRDKTETQGWVTIFLAGKTATRAFFTPLPVAGKPLCIRVSEERASEFVFFKDFVSFC